MLNSRRLLMCLLMRSLFLLRFPYFLCPRALSASFLKRGQHASLPLPFPHPLFLPYPLSPASRVTSESILNGISIVSSEPKVVEQNFLSLQTFWSWAVISIVMKVILINLAVIFLPLVIFLIFSHLLNLWIFGIKIIANTVKCHDLISISQQVAAQTNFFCLPN